MSDSLKDVKRKYLVALADGKPAPNSPRRRKTVAMPTAKVEKPRWHCRVCGLAKLNHQKSPRSHPHHHPPRISLDLCLSVDAALSVSLSLLQYSCDCVVLKLRSLRIHPSPVCVASRCLNTKQRGLNDDVAQSCSPHRMIRVIQTDGLGPRLPAGFLRDWKRTEALDSPSTRLRYMYMHVNTER